jgi:hypothetical protein
MRASLAPEWLYRPDDWVGAVSSELIGHLFVTKRVTGEDDIRTSIDRKPTASCFARIPRKLVGIVSAIKPMGQR